MSHFIPLISKLQMNRYSRQLLIRAFLLEGALLGIALGWSIWKQIPLHLTLRPTASDCVTGVSAGLLLLAVNYVIVEYGSRYNVIFRNIKQLIQDDVSPLFQHIGIGAVLFIAIISGVAEEIFFRGVLQAQFGIWVASCIFGLAHIWKKAAIPYGIYAALIGLVFGAIYTLSGNLWIPILAHIVNNFVAILYYIHRLLAPKTPVVSEKI